MYKTAQKTIPELLIVLVDSLNSVIILSTVDKLELSLHIGFCYISLSAYVVLLSQFDALTNIDSVITE